MSKTQTHVALFLTSLERMSKHVHLFAERFFRINGQMLDVGFPFGKDFSHVD